MMFLAAAAMSVPITTTSLLSEMANLDRLCWPADYTQAQFSSYDRASKLRGDKTWFANADWGQYLRQEGNEWVMADMKGPGAINRIWSANPQGTLRIYLDGDPKPVVESEFKKFFQDFGMPFGYDAANGWDVYFPFPYAKSCKVTLEGPNSNRVYYHVGYRTYAPDAQVETYSPQNQPNRSEVSQALMNGGTRSRVRWTADAQEITGTGVVESIKYQLPPALMSREEFPRLQLKVTVDGKVTVWVPFSTFFAVPVTPKTFQSLPLSVNAEQGIFESRWRMPYRESIKIQLLGQRLRIATPTPQVTYRKVGDQELPPYRFVSSYGYDQAPSRPMRDLPCLRTFREQGRFVGVTLHVENTAVGWWGEGDEKVFVDGESFPSTFGTGTEDYFGYAWSTPQPFARPYHGQPRADGPGNFGHISNFRWQIFDDIPYKRSLDFAIEAWHWVDTDCRWRWVNYRYADPTNLVSVSEPVYLRPRDLKVEVVKAKDALEGENLKVARHQGGKLEHQGGFANLSSGFQLWWTGVHAGDALDLNVPVPSAGTYKVEINACHAKDYGIHQLWLGSTKLGTIDFYSSELGWKTSTFEAVKLNEGTAKLSITCTGFNPAAIPAGMFGLDWIRLTKVKS